MMTYQMVIIVSRDLRLPPRHFMKLTSSSILNFITNQNGFFFKQ